MESLVINNIAKISFVTARGLANIWLSVSALMVVMLTLQYVTPDVVEQYELPNKLCKDQLKQFNRTPSPPYPLEFSNSQDLSDEHICFVCLKNTKAIYRPFAIYLRSNQSFRTVQQSLLFSTQSPKQSCWANLVDLTSPTLFPEVSLPPSNHDFLVVQNNEMHVMSWQPLTPTLNQSQLFITTQPKVQETYLLQRFSKDIDPEYHLTHLRETYFVMNQVFFMFWIGGAMILGLLVSTLSESPLEDSPEVLVPTRKTYFYLMLVLNNNPLFPFQVIDDIAIYRYLNQVMAMVAQGMMLYYILEGLRRIK